MPSTNDSRGSPGRSQLIERGRQIAEELGAGAPDKVKATLVALFCRVAIRSDRVDIALSRGRLTQLLAGSLDLTMQHQAPTSAPDDLLGLTVPVGLEGGRSQMANAGREGGWPDPRRSQLAQNHCACSPHPGAPDPKPQADRAGYRSRRASLGSLPLFPPASSLAGARHHNGHHQWPKTAATHRPDIDAPDAAAAGRPG